MGACQCQSGSTAEEIEAEERELEAQRRRDEQELAEQRRRDAMAPMSVVILRADAAPTEIKVKQWQNVLQSVREGLGLDPGEWALEVGYPGGETFPDDATWESEGESSVHGQAIQILGLVLFASPAPLPFLPFQLI